MIKLGVNMLKKFCEKCRKYSYSSTGLGTWFCPTCGHDLSSKPIKPLNNNDIDKTKKDQKAYLLSDPFFSHLNRKSNLGKAK